MRKSFVACMSTQNVGSSSEDDLTIRGNQKNIKLLLLSHSSYLLKGDKNLSFFKYTKTTNGMSKHSVKIEAKKKEKYKEPLAPISST